MKGVSRMYSFSREPNSIFWIEFETKEEKERREDGAYQNLDENMQNGLNQLDQFQVVFVSIVWAWQSALENICDVNEKISVLNFAPRKPQKCVSNFRKV